MDNFDFFGSYLPDSHIYIMSGTQTLSPCEILCDHNLTCIYYPSIKIRIEKRKREKELLIRHVGESEEKLPQKLKGSIRLVKEYIRDANWFKLIDLFIEHNINYKDELFGKQLLVWSINLDHSDNVLYYFNYKEIARLIIKFELVHIIEPIKDNYFELSRLWNNICKLNKC